MQKEHIFQRHGAWYVRNRSGDTENTKIVCNLRCERLADFNDKYRTKQSVRQKAGDFLDRLSEVHEEVDQHWNLYENGRLNPKQAV